MYTEFRVAYSSQPSYDGAPYPSLASLALSYGPILSSSSRGLKAASLSGIVRSALDHETPKSTQQIMAELLSRGHSWADDRKRLHRMLCDMCDGKRGVDRVGSPYRFFLCNAEQDVGIKE